MARAVAAAAFVGLAVCGCGSQRVVRAAFVRSCGSSGTGGLSPTYKSRGLRLGPLVLANVRTFRPTAPLPPRRGTLYGAYEIIAVVRNGAVATLSVPAAERATVRLLYDPGKFTSDGLYRLSALDSTVTFRACTDPGHNHGVTQFDGGFVVTRRQCLRVALRDGERKTYQGEFSAGAPCRRQA